ncbi:Fibroblast growth factor receptor [Trichinella spiralis]|uniref:Fibroblast growth factor receptor n=1 Tax=Trichinella spiralis TaxID=6334 RepID=A0ABR3K1U8_TRISP
MGLLIRSFLLELTENLRGSRDGDFDEWKRNGRFCQINKYLVVDSTYIQMACSVDRRSIECKTAYDEQFFSILTPSSFSSSDGYFNGELII